MSHIFISYARKDIEFAGRIVQALATHKLDSWIDWKSIPKGEEWEQEIYRGIEGGGCFPVSGQPVFGEIRNVQ